MRGISVIVSSSENVTLEVLGNVGGDGPAPSTIRDDDDDDDEIVSSLTVNVTFVEFGDDGVICKDGRPPPTMPSGMSSSVVIASSRAENFTRAEFGDDGVDPMELS